MTDSNASVGNGDMKTLVADAQALFHTATSLTGEKAEEARNRGMHMLDTAIASLHDAQQGALIKGKAMAASADGYVKENPWRVIATAAGVGLLVGVLIGRR